MHTKFCPHCGSQKIRRVKEKVTTAYITETGAYEAFTYEHYHECKECQETWSHYVVEKEK